MRFARVSLIVLLVAGVARAQPDVETARKLYDDANASYKLEKFADAARGFEAAYKLVHYPTMLFDIGQAYRRWYGQSHNLDHLRRAIDSYRAFIRDAPGAPQAQIAKKLLPELEQTLQSDETRQREERIAQASGKQAVVLAQELAGEGDWIDAARVLDRVLGGGGNSRELLIPAFRWRAMAAAALGDHAVAVEAFARLLVLDPAPFLPDHAPPGAAEALLEAQRRIAGQKPLALQHQPPGDVPPGAAAQVGVGIASDPLHEVSELTLHYRRDGAGAYATVRAPASAHSLAIPPAFLLGMQPGTRIDYYLDARDSRDDELVRLGAPDEPFVFAIAPPPVSEVAPRKKKWWVLGVVAGVAAVSVGVGLGAWYGTHPADNPPTASLPIR